jgi:hypothetical protein
LESLLVQFYARQGDVDNEGTKAAFSALLDDPAVIHDINRQVSESLFYTKNDNQQYTLKIAGEYEAYCATQSVDPWSPEFIANSVTLFLKWKIDTTKGRLNSKLQPRTL